MQVGIYHAVSFCTQAAIAQESACLQHLSLPIPGLRMQANESGIVEWWTVELVNVSFQIS